MIQVGTRSPVAVAQAALTLDALTGGRFTLGLGSSGPGVIEGLHGVPFARPLTRMRETIDVVRQAFAGEKIAYSGRTVAIPLPGGEGRPMRLSMPANPDLPIYVASLSPRMLELTGEVADGWLGTSFVPEGAAASLDHLDAGLAAPDDPGRPDRLPGRRGRLRRGRVRAGGDGRGATAGPGVLARRDGHREHELLPRRLRPPGLVGGRRRGSRAVAGGDRDGAAAMVPDEMVLATTLLGTEEMVRARLGVWRDAGVDTVRLYPAGESLDERLTTLGRAISLVGGLRPREHSARL